MIWVLTSSSTVLCVCNNMHVAVRIDTVSVRGWTLSGDRSHVISNVTSQQWHTPLLTCVPPYTHTLPLVSPIIDPHQTALTKHKHITCLYTHILTCRWSGLVCLSTSSLSYWCGDLNLFKRLVAFTLPNVQSIKKIKTLRNIFGNFMHWRYEDFDEDTKLDEKNVGWGCSVVQSLFHYNSTLKMIHLNGVQKIRFFHDSITPTKSV